MLQNISLKLDIQILFRTIGVVLFGENKTIKNSVSSVISIHRFKPSAIKNQPSTSL